MNPKFEAAMMQDFYGSLTQDPDLAGLFTPVRHNGLTSPKWSQDIYFHISGKDVEYMQKLLGTPQTGEYDNALNTAVKNFQRTQMNDDLPTGVIDQSTWNSIVAVKGGERKAAAVSSGISLVTGVLQGAFSSNVPTDISTTSAPPPPSSTNWMLIGGLAVAGLIVVGGGIYFLTRD